MRVGELVNKLEVFRKENPNTVVRVIQVNAKTRINCREFARYADREVVGVERIQPLFGQPAYVNIICEKR